MASRILILTRTNWAEPPRIRHQLARLLRDHGHQITFSERPHYIPFKTHRHSEEGIDFVAFPHFMNHQLRIAQWMTDLDSAISRKHIRRLIEEHRPDAIVNFHQDYHFLKTLAPQTPVVTLINDDFEAQAILPGMGRSIARQIEKTCRASDLVLVVSNPLMDKLSPFNTDTHLLLPWAGHRYRKPQSSQDRNAVLFLGYMNYRIDWPVLAKLAANGVRLRLIGPIERKAKQHLAPIRAHSNVEILPPTNFDQLDTTDVCCGIIPYRTDLEAVKAITASNKLFNLLCKGLPVVSMRVDGLISAPDTVIRPCSTIQEYSAAIKYFRENFDEVQPSIERFLEHHYSEDRYALLMQLISRAKPDWISPESLRATT